MSEFFKQRVKKKGTFQITLWVPLSLWSEVNKAGWQTRECA